MSFLPVVCLVVVVEGVASVLVFPAGRGRTGIELLTGLATESVNRHAQGPTGKNSPNHSTASLVNEENVFNF